MPKWDFITSILHHLFLRTPLDGCFCMIGNRSEFFTVTIEKQIDNTLMIEYIFEITDWCGHSDLVMPDNISKRVRLILLLWMPMDSEIK